MKLGLIRSSKIIDVLAATVLSHPQPGPAT
jgi:hypothetical protein